MGVHPDEERAFDAVLLSIVRDCKGDRGDMVFVETPAERRTAMARRAERNAFGAMSGIGWSLKKACSSLAISTRFSLGRAGQHGGRASWRAL